MPWKTDLVMDAFFSVFSNAEIVFDDQLFMDAAALPNEFEAEEAKDCVAADILRTGPVIWSTPLNIADAENVAIYVNGLSSFEYSFASWYQKYKPW